MVNRDSTNVASPTHLLNLDFVIAYPGRVHLLMAILWLLYPPLDMHNGLAVQALRPADHVLRYLAVLGCENSLQRRELRAEDEEYNLRPYAASPMESMLVLVPT